MTSDTPAIRLSGLRKTFGAVEAVAGIDLEIADGEFFSMLGPSGSGKTTVLRLIAGFEQPTAGTIALSGRDVTRLAPFELLLIEAVRRVDPNADVRLVGRALRDLDRLERTTPPGPGE